MNKNATIPITSFRFENGQIAWGVISDLQVGQHVMLEADGVITEGYVKEVIAFKWVSEEDHYQYLLNNMA